MTLMDNVGKIRKKPVDFSNIGGLEKHLDFLKELIIFPLIHANVYEHFQVKPPRGVLFYGPPGTGKTLVAGALANEMQKSDSIGKVAFYYRKGPDILDKWVGASEKALREIFANASRTKPSIIFFDEIDGLAPVRSNQHDHIHASIVATLLSLMDGLDSEPGIIVIGATNRIDNIDPALRRSGRFDKELYFSLPTQEARKDILRVHTMPWSHRPSGDLLEHLASVTNGFCGADLQALCARAVKCCTQRNMMNLSQIRNRKRRFNVAALKVEECDFLLASSTLLPASLTHRTNVRALSNVVKPLLERHLNKILESVRITWPHFLDANANYNLSSSRFAGRIVLKSSHVQSLNMHLIPAVLHKLEHLQMIIPLETFLNRIHDGNFPAPCVLLMSSIDTFWGTIEKYEQNVLLKILYEIHANLPIIIIASCGKEIPEELENFFCNNSTLFIDIEDPTEEEREQFLSPLFSGIDPSSTVLIKNKPPENSEPDHEISQYKTRSIFSNHYKRSDEPLKRNSDGLLPVKRVKYSNEHPKSKKDVNGLRKSTQKENYLAHILTELVNSQTLSSTSSFKVNDLVRLSEDSKVEREKRIYDLSKYACKRVTRKMNIGQLEILYDIISVCIKLYKHSFPDLILNLETHLNRIEENVTN